MPLYGEIFASEILKKPRAPLVSLMVMSSVLNGILQPFALVFALSLVNNKRLMSGYTNPRAYNRVAWATIIAVIALSCVMLVTAAGPFD